VLYSDGVLSDADGSVVIKPCTKAEIDFYESSTNSHPEFAAFMPTYMGTLQLTSKPAESSNTSMANGVSKDKPSTSQTPDHLRPGATKDEESALKGKKLKTEQGLVLSNAAAGFKAPNVLDIKLGARLWDDDAPIEKRERLDKVAAVTTSSSLGFRIAGMKVWQGADLRDTDGIDEEGYRIFDKFYGRNFDAETVEKGFEEYLFVEKAGLSKTLGKILAKRILKDVLRIQQVLEAEESRMYSASILVVCEGNGHVLQQALKEEEQLGPAIDDEIEEDSDDEEQRLKVHTVKMIDFAHATWTRGKGQDENTLQGIRNVAKILGKLSS
jgi:1D-myo-inositol-tetrakisphosphate 5-kinase/inositol-polyphosphate multikinase